MEPRGEKNALANEEGEIIGILEQLTGEQM